MDGEFTSQILSISTFRYHILLGHHVLGCEVILSLAGRVAVQNIAGLVWAGATQQQHQSARALSLFKLFTHYYC